MWFVLSLVGYVLLAVASVLDKFILTKSVNKPVVYTFYSSIIMAAVFVAYPLAEPLYGADWIWAIVSGLGFGLGLWTVYIAVKEGEVTHIGPFNGAMVTIATLFLSAYFLGERLSSVQIFGIIILVFASLLLSWEKSVRHTGFHIGFLWAIASGIFFAISHVSAKHLYDFYPFWTGFVWSRGSTALLGVLLLAYPSVRKSLFKKSRAEQPKTYARKHAVGVMIANKSAATIGVIILHYAFSIGSVTLINAMSGIQYGLIFLMIYVFTRMHSGIIREYFTRRELMVETMAIILVALGSVMFVV